MTHKTTLLDQETEKLINWAKSILESSDSKSKKAKALAKKLGAHYNDGVTTIGFWTPELKPVEDD